jgi:glycosyltransferase involved in cell wall biosynthesis
MEVKISVVIPTYRRPDLLLKCIDALKRQTFCTDDYEVLVVSDGPDESTAQAVSQTSWPQLKFMYTPEKKGPAAARNLGWLKAKGTLIAFTDDDCVPAKDWLETIWQQYTGEDEIAFTGRIIVPISKSPTDYELNVTHLETAEFVTANSVCTKKALLRVGGFDERFRMAWREDSDLHFKLIEDQIPIRKIPATVVHPVRQAPWGVSIKEQKKGIFNALLYKKYPHLYRKCIKPGPSWNYYAMILLFTGICTGLVIKSHPVTIICSSGWVVMVLAFSHKRLAQTSHSADHVLEMLVTSMVIPFLSVYWQFYGSLKYRVLML